MGLAPTFPFTKHEVPSKRREPPVCFGSVRFSVFGFRLARLSASRAEAQRKAGELRGPEKSAVERSTEAVARSLASAKAQARLAVQWVEWVVEWVEWVGGW